VIHTIFEGTSEIQQLLISRAISGLCIEWCWRGGSDVCGSDPGHIALDRSHRTPDPSSWERSARPHSHPQPRRLLLDGIELFMDADLCGPSTLMSGRHGRSAASCGGVGRVPPLRYVVERGWSIGAVPAIEHSKLNLSLAVDAIVALLIAVAVEALVGIGALQVGIAAVLVIMVGRDGTLGSTTGSTPTIS
jgi:hypothetical protein